MQAQIAKVAFITSIISYGACMFFEYVRPGFVQYVFSIHWFLIASIAMGFWWGVTCRSDSPGWIERCIKGSALVFIGLVCGLVVWKEGEIFGAFRCIVAVIGCIVPIILARLFIAAHRCS